MAFIICLTVQWTAWKKGFYYLPPTSKKSVSTWSMIASFILYFGVTIGVILLWQRGAHPLSTEDKGWLVVTSAIGASLSLLFFASFFPKIWGEKKKWINGCLSWIVAFPLVFLLDRLFSIIYPLPKELEQDAIRIFLASKDYPVLFALTIFCIVVLIPVAEEILFRGFLQNFLRRFGRVFAILISSLFFSAMHFSEAQGVANIQLLTTLFVLSCFLGYLYEKERSLWAPIGLHMVFNGMTILFLTAGWT